MIDFQAIADVFTKVTEVFKHHLPDKEPWIASSTTAWISLGSGAVLAFVGAKLLRFIFVGLFMISGGYLGIYVADRFQVDSLFGLVVGGAVLGLLGHFLFRWWVGVTTGLLAMALVAAVAGPRMLPTLKEDLAAFAEQETDDTVGEYSNVLQKKEEAQSDDRTLVTLLNDLKSFLWNRHEGVAMRLAGMIALAWLGGMAVGVVAPRHTTIVLTSILGVILLAGGGGYMVYNHWPAAWEWTRRESGWVLAGLMLMMVVAIAVQMRMRRPIAAPPAAPAES